MADEEQAAPDMVAEDQPQAPEPAPEEPVEEEITSYMRVRYDAPPGTDTPIQQVGRYWHDRTTHTLAPHEVELVRALPGFRVWGPAPAPGNKSP